MKTWPLQRVTFLYPASPVPPLREESTSNSVWDLILDTGTFGSMSLMDKDSEGEGEDAACQVCPRSP